MNHLIRMRLLVESVDMLLDINCPVKQRQALLGSNLSRNSRVWVALNNATGEDVHYLHPPCLPTKPLFKLSLLCLENPI